MMVKVLALPEPLCAFSPAASFANADIGERARVEFAQSPPRRGAPQPAGEGGRSGIDAPAESAMELQERGLEKSGLHAGTLPLRTGQCYGGGRSIARDTGLA